MYALSPMRLLFLACVVAFGSAATIDPDAVPSYYDDDDDDISLPGFDSFLERFGDVYGYNNTIDSIRESDMKRLKGAVYLDYTGSGVYRESQVTKCASLLTSDLFGNAHSRSQSSMNTEIEVIGEHEE